MTEHNELVKEYYFNFEGSNEKIEARLYHCVLNDEPKAAYMWVTSHNHRQADQGEVYKPGGPYGSTVEECEGKLMQYVKGFETAVETRVNPLF